MPAVNDETGGMNDEIDHANDETEPMNDETAVWNLSFQQHRILEAFVYIKEAKNNYLLYKYPFNLLNEIRIKDQLLRIET